LRNFSGLKKKRPLFLVGGVLFSFPIRLENKTFYLGASSFNGSVLEKDGGDLLFSVGVFACVN
jgi:hypothetical protein